ncbi:hypothetical protein EH31_04045 [Erythrobacter longus]|uniref:Uncharacterized protein n=1 Tax=Erythrobacter longus TaxID=1044 RepID=A0A074MEE4_ERYLO|nr:hypothetical protein [Erythrobacter longus]KEO91854.1 hypothetical protein EH31_04045 [Erythrobacter longus]
MLRFSLFLAVWHLQLLHVQLLLTTLQPQPTKLRLKKLHVKALLAVLLVKALHVKLLVKALHVKLLVKALHVKLLVKALLAKLLKLTHAQVIGHKAFQFGRGQHKLPPVVLYLGPFRARNDRV